MKSEMAPVWRETATMARKRQRIAWIEVNEIYSILKIVIIISIYQRSLLHFLISGVRLELPIDYRLHCVALSCKIMTPAKRLISHKRHSIGLGARRATIELVCSRFRCWPQTQTPTSADINIPSRFNLRANKFTILLAQFPRGKYK